MKKIGLSIGVILLGAAAIWLWLSAREADKPFYRVAVVQLTEVDAGTLRGFKSGLQALGYYEGDNIAYLNDKPAGQADKLDALIRRQLEPPPDLVFCSSTPATLAVKQRTANTGIPVVFAPVNDPQGAGIVTNLKAPGGTITGIRLPAGDDLRLHWLHKIAPQAKRVWIPYTPTDKSAQASLIIVRKAARQLGLDLHEQAVDASANLKQLLAELPDTVEAIFLPRDSTIEAQIHDFAALARARRLPLAAPSFTQVEAGALFSYGFVHAEIGKQAARLADQIFKGIAPADLPVEMAENYLAINLGSARAIGLEIPESLLAQAEYLLRD